MRSVPGVGHIAASVLISEIGDVSDFSSGKKLAAWTGIVPSIYQSAGTLRTGSITKRGNRHLWWILVEIAHSCARMKGTKLWTFFERIKKRSGYKKAIVALARKNLTIIWHLLTYKELFVDESYIPKKQSVVPAFLTMVRKIGIDEALSLIQNAKKEVGIQRTRGILLESGQGV
ncbi:transposase [Methanogenium marinum]|uniref:Transposase n=1 Tax=Methanogenium marinum TaxID=348610 RepID=A0A9Q4KMV3_9EURY|nr:transposase [Methanogenium marinum]MDE4907353.1 transposase [Methanogenium marinum]